MSRRLSAPHQVTSADPYRAVAVLEAHLGQQLAAWQVYLVVAMLTPRRLWAEGGGPRA